MDVHTVRRTLVDEYRVPAHAGEGFLETKGSRFYGRALLTADEKAVEALLASARALYPSASHHTYAYRLGRTGSIARFSDDGEPGGTAGRPMMEVLLRAEVVDVAVVVSRIFGGVLLGAGGLTRAYSSMAAAAVRDAGIVVRRPFALLKVTVSYDLLGAVEAVLRREGVVGRDVDYGGVVSMIVPVGPEAVAALTVALGDATSGRARIALGETTYDAS